MTPKLTLTAVIAIAALLLAPAAWSQASPDVFERAVAARQAQQTDPIVSPDAVDRAVAARQTTGRTLVFDDHRTTTTATSVPGNGVSGSDRGIEWPQLGLGFATGILLAFGLMLAVRGLRIRQLAH